MPVLPPPAPRGPTTKEYLRMAWDYAVYKAPEERPSEGTSVKAARQALSREEAIRAIAGSDTRPLLVVRECAVCNKTDNALLKPGADNEKIILLSRWFHCVKLPVDVLQPDHPFNTLFPDKKSEHLFVSSVNGTDKIPLESDTSRVELCAAMTRVLLQNYAKDPTPATKDIQHSFDRLDILDGKIRDLERSRDDLLETAGKLDRDKVKKLDREIDATRKEIEGLRSSIERLSKLDLKLGKKPERS